MLRTYIMISMKRADLLNHTLSVFSYTSYGIKTYYHVYFVVDKPILLCKSRVDFVAYKYASLEPYSN